MLALLLSGAATISFAGPMPSTLSTRPSVAQAPKRSAAVQSAIDALTKALQDGDKAARVRAIETAAPLSDPALVPLFGKGLWDRDAGVRDAAIQALRFCREPGALGALEDYAKRDGGLRKQAGAYTAVLKAIAQHASASSIDLLVDDLWSVPDPGVIQARILGLARIREPRALEKLFGLMRQAGGPKIAPYMDEFRMALMLLTGADHGTSQDAWLAWWNEHRGKLVVAAAPPPLPKQLQRRWEQYWGLELSNPRPEKRSDRGKDS
jgi:hypothetical protein